MAYGHEERCESVGLKEKLNSFSDVCKSLRN